MANKCGPTFKATPFRMLSSKAPRASPPLSLFTNSRAGGSPLLLAAVFDKGGGGGGKGAPLAGGGGGGGGVTCAPLLIPIFAGVGGGGAGIPIVAFCAADGGGGGGGAADADTFATNCGFNVGFGGVGGGVFFLLPMVAYNGEDSLLPV